MLCGRFYKCLNPWATEVSKTLIERGRAKLYLQTLVYGSQSICERALVCLWAGELLLLIESSLALQVSIFKVVWVFVFLVFLLLLSSPLSPEAVSSSPFPTPPLRMVSQMGLTCFKY